MTFTLQPVFGKQLIGRDELIKEIVTILSDKRSNTGYVLYGIRRIGKTSILKEIEARFKEKKFVAIYVSLWEIVPFTIENFLEEMTMKIMESYKKYISLKYKVEELMATPLDMLRKIIKNLKISVKLKEEIEFLISFKQQKRINYTELIKKAFSLPEKLAKETGIKCIILMDEFPTILELKEGMSFVRAIRTIHESQKHTAFCISGSIRKTMELVALSSASPFYKQFIAKEIKPLKKEDIEKMIKINFREYNVEVKDVINEIYSFTKGIPFYIHIIGKITLAKGIKILNKKTLKDVLYVLLTEEGNILFLDFFHSLSIKEQEILAKMASQDLHNISEIAKATDEMPNIISTYILYLIDKGVIEKQARGTYDFVDSIFKEWLKSRIS